MLHDQVRICKVEAAPIIGSPCHWIYAYSPPHGGLQVDGEPKIRPSIASSAGFVRTDKDAHDVIYSPAAQLYDVRA